MIVLAFGLLLVAICLSFWLRGSGIRDPNGETEAPIIYAMQDVFVKIKGTASEPGGQGINQDLPRVYSPRTISITNIIYIDTRLSS